MVTFTLPQLPYSYDALEPYIDAATMEVHYTKHHQNYLNKLNEALTLHPDLPDYSLEDLLQNLKELPEDIQTPVRNNAGGTYNHNLFWKTLSPYDGSKPGESLLTSLNSKYGDLNQFKDEFGQKALSVFGSGWAWLVLDKGDLNIITTQNQDSPISLGLHPILAIDVWEHAYYLKYQNRRADYINAWWNLVNWPNLTITFEEYQEKISG